MFCITEREAKLRGLRRAEIIKQKITIDGESRWMHVINDEHNIHHVTLSTGHVEGVSGAI